MKPSVILSALILLIATLTACGSNSESQSSNTQNKGATDEPNSLPTSGPSRTDAELTFQHFEVIREFGSKDTGAVFGIAPSRGTFKLTGVRGPVFLGSVHTGQVSAAELGRQFSVSSVPMLQKEKDELLSKYSGATFIYFDHYDGRLCSEQEFHITISGTVEAEKFDFTFAFSAKPSASGNCQFHATAFCQGSGNPSCDLPN